MNSNCRVCNVELKLKYSKCPYCGYSNNVAFTVSGDDSEEYKQNVLNNIKNISVNAGNFKYIESEKTMKKIGTISLFDKDLDGTECSRKITLSKEWIAHFEGEEKLIVNYLFRGKQKSVTAVIKSEKWEGICHLALHINKDLRLEIGVHISPINGDEKERTKLLDTVDLDLIA